VKVVLLGSESSDSTHHLAFTATIGAESILGPREALTNSNDTETSVADRFLHGKFKPNVTVLQQTLPTHQ